MDESNIVLELLRTVKLRVNVDGGNWEVNLTAITGLQVPFTNPDFVRRWAFGASEAVSGAKDPSAGDESSTANVLSLASAHHTQRDLVGKLSMAGWMPVDDVVAVII